MYALIVQEQVTLPGTEEHIDKVYDGSIKLFFTTFLKKEKLSKDAIEELKEIVEQYGSKE